MDFATTQVLFNPALPDARINSTKALLLQKEFDEPHLWISTSGSFAKEGVSKWAALSVRAIFASADAVNTHLEATKDDIWLNPLPLFHVGGLGIKCRAHISNAKEFEFKSKWYPDLFIANLLETKATLTALVPTQLFDLVLKAHKSPSHLRAVVIGGGALDEKLYQAAKTLGWNILPSYGMTEVASQIATASLNEDTPTLKLLSHVKVSSDENGLLQIESSSLFTTYGIIEGESVNFLDPKKEGVFTTTDRGEVLGKKLTVFGRADDIVKILGENVDIAKLQKKIDSLKIELQLQGDFFLIARPDTRSGNALCLIFTGPSDELVALFNQSVFPFERITLLEKREFLPKTALGKIERKKL